MIGSSVPSMLPSSARKRVLLHKLTWHIETGTHKGSLEYLADEECHKQMGLRQS